MRLFVANTSQKNQILNFRLPESSKLFSPTIRACQQAPVGGHLDKMQIDAIVKQLAPYGLVGVDELNRAREVIPYVYSIDTPVSAETILRVASHNKGVLFNRGKKFREEAAIAASEQIDTAIAEQHGEAPALKGFTMEIEEDRKNTFDGQDAPIEEGFRRGFGGRDEARARAT